MKPEQIAQKLRDILAQAATEGMRTTDQGKVDAIELKIVKKGVLKLIGDITFGPVPIPRKLT